ncbi:MULTISPECIES: OsmC family protein [Halorussus]|uniref:OsmC family protein n=1 Tax=Halorussus TaxID=1070314 RepID=UPI0020A0916E|nr:OsmC family protein [Halorussus vallis]USZ78331.1 OsmC family protein [Halorussus vallis]USZ78354.1 OsmC family protein [Halorussus vallis]
MVVDWSLQDAVWDEIETLRDANRVPVGENEVTATLQENFHGRAEARAFDFESDEPATMAGGENRGPRPLEYFLAGFAFCQQVIYAKNALATGIEIDDLSIDVSGDVDPRGVLGVDGASPGFVDDEIRYTTRIESPAHPDEVRELVDLAERHCPAHAALREPMSFDRDIVLNGERLD